MVYSDDNRVALYGEIADPFSIARRQLADLRDASKVLPPGVVATRRPDGTVRRAESIGNCLYCVGDSLTFGTGDEATLGGWPGRLATLTGFTVVNGGIAGQSSSDIVLRQGGIVPLVSVVGNIIPSTGTVAVGSLKPATSWRITNAFSFDGFVVDTSGAVQPVTLAHSGTSVAPDKSWTLARTSGSGAITITPETPFYVTTADAYLDYTNLIWVGRNNSSPNDFKDAVRDALAAVAHLRPIRPRYLVFSIINTTAEPSGTGAYGLIMAANARLATTFGDRYVDVRRYLIDHGLADAGITPTTQDNTDIAGDTIPTSLRAAADTLHLNAAGYTVLANYLKTVLIAKGWAQGSVLFSSTFSGIANAALNVEVGTATWSTTDANWKQDGSGNAYNSAPGATSYAVADTGAADCVVRVVMAGTFNVGAGLTLRYQDGSNQLALTWEDASGLAPRLAHRIANVSTVVTPTSQVSGVWVAGDVLEVTLNGSSITLTKNGATVGQWTDSSFATLTRHGMFMRSTASAVRFSEIKVSTLP